MSLEGYILQKAYHFSIAGVGINDNERYFKALGEINNVLSCKKEPKLNPDLFNEDSRQVYRKTKKQLSMSLQDQDFEKPIGII